jgi:tRNA-2-methylthio-N6-dimethylallyladenosine synthase
MNQKQAFIETFGCQMNERDSEIIGRLLEQSDYVLTRRMDRADLILLNTCSIRAKAEQKVYSLLGRIKMLKQNRPSTIIAVAGCIAQQEGPAIKARMPHVDIVLGTQHIFQLPSLVAQAEKGDKPRPATSLSATFTIPSFVPQEKARRKIEHPAAVKKFVTIMQGCNNFCTYCVVPYTRGREVSRPASDILAEVTDLAARGCREVTLLGQNVNSYGKKDEDDIPDTDFPMLLREIADIPGIERIRFTTSNPKDLSDQLIQCFADLNKLCPHFHLPVQSGSDHILKRMNRKYTIASYRRRVSELRRCRPDIALSTDIIVGFPGETERDFQATLKLLEDIRYHSAFSFKYSDRPQAVSASFRNKIPEPVKTNRLKILQDLQNRLTLERNKEYIGQRLLVMVEGPSRAADGQISGRSGSNHIVNFDAEELAPGTLVEVKITEGLQHSLRGTLI